MGGFVLALTGQIEDLKLNSSSGGVLLTARIGVKSRSYLVWMESSAERTDLAEKFEEEPLGAGRLQ
jgi:hypothetical protein